MESAPASVAGDELQIAYVPPTEEQYAASLDAVNKEFGLIGMSPVELDRSRSGVV
jgi:hypothetical protein